MGANLNYAAQLKSTTCCACGMEFAMPTEYYQRRLNDHQPFFCPTGHRQWFTAETEEARLRQALEAAQRQRDAEKLRREGVESQLKGARQQLGKARAKAQRLERRVNAGVCPHCQRTVSQMAKHIQTKHPEQTVPPPLREVEVAKEA